jgi:hypothetical protein
MADGMPNRACGKYGECAMRTSGSGCIVVQIKVVECLVWANWCTQSIDKEKLLAGSEVLVSGGTDVLHPDMISLHVGYGSYLTCKVVFFLHRSLTVVARVPRRYL